ncbi:HlyD family secretion protein [Sphingobacterium sp.]|uniref:HlyD family secretion protein n=1 Tax=Sphingobacterium sp. TaxID=341027 RepID=UPI00289B4253|nr:HlyD family secretion protein [Sphingobacterium sp.]
MSNVENISYRSQDTDSFINIRPSFLERNGIIIIVAIIIGLTIGSYFVSYPEKVEQVGYLSNENSPKAIILPSGRVISKIMFAAGSEVDNGSVVLWLKSDIEYQQIALLKEKLQVLEDIGKKINKGDLEFFLKKAFIYESSELSVEYANFLKDIMDYFDVANNSLYKNEKVQIGNHINLAKEKSKIYHENIRLSAADIEDYEGLNHINKELFDKGLITIDEFKNSESQNKSRQRQLNSLHVELNDNKNLIALKESEYMKLSAEEERKYNNLKLSIYKLIGAVNKWIKQNSVQAGCKGRFELNSFLQEGDYAPSNTVVGYIVPGNSEFYVKTSINQAKISKIDLKTPVEVRLDAYPYKNFGSVVGEIKRISNVVTDSGLVSKIMLKDGLVTTTGHTLEYKENLRGKVILTTKNERLLNKLLEGISHE